METFKIIFIGPKGVGKTTLRKVLFDQEDPVNLLQTPLEPTYGPESTLYSMGARIAIHDLAGQQLNEWLYISPEIFTDANLIFIFVDPNDIWENSKNTWEKVLENCQIYCPEAFITVLFHKIDLLSETSLQELSKKVSAEFQNTKIDAIFTSVNPEFLIPTLKTITSILNKTMNPNLDFNSQFAVSNADILSLFFNQDEVSIINAMAKLHTTADQLLKKIDDLIFKKYFVMDPMSSDIKLTDKGREFVATFKQYLNVKIRKIKTPEKFLIKGLIIADYTGKVLSIFEYEENFFKTLLTDPEANVDPNLIAMFFSAIRQFGLTMHPSGFSSMHIMGEELQMVHIYYHDIFAIFFFENIEFESSINLLLFNFMVIFYEIHEMEIQKFVIQGFLKDIEQIQNDIGEYVKEIDTEIKKNLSINHQFSQQTLLTLYHQINTTCIGHSLFNDELKDLFIHYLVTKDTNVLNDLNLKLRKNACDDQNLI